MVPLPAGGVPHPRRAAALRYAHARRSVETKACMVDHSAEAGASAPGQLLWPGLSSCEEQLLKEEELPPPANDAAAASAAAVAAAAVSTAPSANASAMYSAMYSARAPVSGSTRRGGCFSSTVSSCQASSRLASEAEHLEAARFRLSSERPG